MLGVGAGQAAIAIEGGAAAAVFGSAAEVPGGASPQPFPSAVTELLLAIRIGMAEGSAARREGETT